jgi:hypothetical protein
LQNAIFFCERSVTRIELISESKKQIGCILWNKFREIVSNDANDGCVTSTARNSDATLIDFACPWGLQYESPDHQITVVTYCSSGYVRVQAQTRDPACLSGSFEMLWE